METNDSKVSTYFRLPTLRLTELRNTLAVVDKEYMKNTYPVKQDKYLFGIEIEMENVRQQDTLYYWNTTTDNSLRNNGAEFVSRPLRMEQIEGALTELTNKVNNDHVFSGRTSVHVHMNVRDQNISQIMNLVTLYLAVEGVLFKWVGHDRDKNPFCIPISEAGYYKNLLRILKNPPYLRECWNKYSALNLVPISEKGTIEFRHMYGTLDIKTLMTWINLLACLKDKAKSSSLTEIYDQIKPLNSTSDYHVFLYDIFGDYVSEFANYPFQELMEHNITQLKLGFIKKETQTNNGITFNVGTLRNPTTFIIRDDPVNRQPTQTEIRNAYGAMTQAYRNANLENEPSPMATLQYAIYRYVHQDLHRAQEYVTACISQLLIRQGNF